MDDDVEIPNIVGLGLDPFVDDIESVGSVLGESFLDSYSPELGETFEAYYVLDFKGVGRREGGIIIGGVAHSLYLLQYIRGLELLCRVRHRRI